MLLNKLNTQKCVHARTFTIVASFIEFQITNRLQTTSNNQTNLFLHILDSSPQYLCKALSTLTLFFAALQHSPPAWNKSRNSWTKLCFTTYAWYYKVQQLRYRMDNKQYVSHYLIITISNNITTANNNNKTNTTSPSANYHCRHHSSSSSNSSSSSSNFH